MPWLRLDDGFTEHPKLIALGGRADRWTWLEVLNYCNRRRTNGRIPSRISDVIRHATPGFLERCVSVGLVDRKDGDLFVHDFAFYNGDTNEDRIRAYVSQHPNATANQVLNAIGGRKQTVLACLSEIRGSEVVPEQFPNGSGLVPEKFPKVPDAGTTRAVPILKDSLSQGVLETPRERERLGTEDERRAAWIAYAEATPGIRSPAAYARTGFDSGDWPPDHDASSSAADPVVAAERWITGHGWDETFTPEMVGEELQRIERATHATIPLDALRGLVEAWQAERDRRYPERTNA